MTTHQPYEDLPSALRGAEWWYLHCHLTTPAGQEHGLACTFLRHRLTGEGAGPMVGHALWWARADGDRQARTGGSWLDQGYVELLRVVAATDPLIDPHLRPPLVAALSAGRPVPPDLPLTGPVRVPADRLDLDYGGVGRLRKQPDGSYRLALAGAGERHELIFTPTRPPVAQGGNGPLVARFHDTGGGSGGHTVPRLLVRGTMTTAGGPPAPVSGTGWYEHTFGAAPDPDSYLQRPVRNRQWLGIQLDNGWDIAASVAERIDPGSRAVLDRTGTAVGYSPTGERIAGEPHLELRTGWTSLATFNSYPEGCRLRIPELDLDLEVTARFRPQEHRTMIAGTGFLQAWAEARGTMAGRPVRGSAFLEVVPDGRVPDLEEYMGRLRPIVLAEVRTLYPDDPAGIDEPALADLVGVGGAALDGISAAQVHEILVRPVRHVLDAGGKGWRAFVTCAAIEMFGVASDPYRQLLAVTELIQTCNLMIDDVQDESPLRRGRPAAHVVFGAPTSINAGTAGYFVFDRVTRRVLPDDPELRLRVYETYLRCMRAAHVGQGLDILGRAPAMDAAVEGGDPTGLLRAIRASHRLKTGLPARAFGEVGALIAGATEQQVAAVGDYFEAAGMAYQITDDVLDLEGITAVDAAGRRYRTKHSCEDLRAGKVTMPLAHAVRLLAPDRVAAIWRTVRGGGTDLDTARGIAEEIIDCGAVRACHDEARVLVERAWRLLADQVPDSPTKILLQAFGHYVAWREQDPTGELTTA